MDPHPYRLALSCLDTPRAPCEPPKKRQFPMEALILACAFVAAGSGLATLHAVGHGGHVEIAPAALTHLTKPKPRPRRVEGHPRSEHVLESVAQLPLVRGGTHDSKTLFAAAKQLEAAGLDVTVMDVQLPTAHWPSESFFPKSMPAVRGLNGHVDGVELRGIPLDSPMRLVGIMEGDQLLGVNGYTFADDTIDGAGLMHARNLGWTIVEIARGNHHVVLSIHWQVP